jgi:hypothetical protein
MGKIMSGILVGIIRHSKFLIGCQQISAHYAFSTYVLSVPLQALPHADYIIDRKSY